MPRLIDADALICKWKAAMLHMVKEEDGMHPISMEVLIEDLENAPTIEAEPVKHGRWVLKERAHYFKCSLCNEPIPYKFGYSESRRYYNYCPNCGAKMDGGKE